MTIIIRKTTEADPVTLYPHQFSEEPVRKAIKHESLTGNVYHKIMKLRKRFVFSAHANDTDKGLLEALQTEDYVQVVIGSTTHTCIMAQPRYIPLKSWGDGFWEVRVEVEERGWL